MSVAEKVREALEVAAFWREPRPMNIPTGMAVLPRHLIALADGYVALLARAEEAERERDDEFQRAENGWKRAGEHLIRAQAAEAALRVAREGLNAWRQEAHFWHWEGPGNSQFIYKLASIPQAEDGA